MGSNDEVTDELLWADSLAGDGRAFAELFRRHRDRVFFYALRTMKSAHEAGEVTAIVFLEAWRLRGRVRLVDGSLRPWLLVTANNVARNQARSRTRYTRLLQQLPSPEPEEDHAVPILYELQIGSAKRSVREAFLNLSIKGQEILALCVLEELPIFAVSRLLGLPLSSAKSRLFRAKKKLERILADDGVDPRTAEL